MTTETDEGIVYTGNGWDIPLKYKINRALCLAVKSGNWDTTMLKNLADWAMGRLENE